MTIPRAASNMPALRPLPGIIALVVVVTVGVVVILRHEAASDPPPASGIGARAMHAVAAAEDGVRSASPEPRAAREAVASDPSSSADPAGAPGKTLEARGTVRVRDETGTSSEPTGSIRVAERVGARTTWDDLAVAAGRFEIRVPVGAVLRYESAVLDGRDALVEAPLDEVDATDPRATAIRAVRERERLRVGDVGGGCDASGSG